MDNGQRKKNPTPFLVSLPSGDISSFLSVMTLQRFGDSIIISLVFILLLGPSHMPVCRLSPRLLGISLDPLQWSEWAWKSPKAEFRSPAIRLRKYGPALPVSIMDIKTEFPKGPVSLGSLAFSLQ